MRAPNPVSRTMVRLLKVAAVGVGVDAGAAAGARDKLARVAKDKPPVVTAKWRLHPNRDCQQCGRGKFDRFSRPNRGHKALPIRAAQVVGTAKGDLRIASRSAPEVDTSGETNLLSRQPRIGPRNRRTSRPSPRCGLRPAHSLRPVALPTPMPNRRSFYIPAGAS
jgi:hypothetical protein